MKYKVNELTGDNLNHAVALAQKWSKSTKFGVPIYTDENGTNTEYCKGYDPEHNWTQCGELIDKFRIDLSHENNKVIAKTYDYEWIKAVGITAQQAICRCVVDSVFGDEVEL